MLDILDIHIEHFVHFGISGAESHVPFILFYLIKKKKKSVNWKWNVSKLIILQLQ